MKTKLSAAPGYRSAVFMIVCLAMALTALTTTPACAQPEEAGQFGDPASEVRAFQLSRGLLPAKVHEIDPGPAP